MEYLIGVGLALGVCAFAMLAGFDRDLAAAKQERRLHKILDTTRQ